jgi:hypothetical protein
VEIEYSAGTDYGFVERELEKAGYLADGERGQRVTDAVTALFAVLDGQELDLDDRAAVSKLFASLVVRDGDLGNTAGPRSIWKQFYLGSFKYGATVRVKVDAYDTPAGSKHNGLTGTFVSVHAARARVQYHGRKDGSGHEHHPSKLEILWKNE